jgi:gluconolactonase
MSPELPIEAFEIFAGGLDHPECLAFDASGALWAGGEAGQVYRISPDGRVETVANLGGFCAGVAFDPSGRLFVCNTTLGIVRVAGTGEVSVFADSIGARKLICPNFGVFDSNGNYFVTDSGNWKKRNGLLLRYTPDGSGSIVDGPFGYTNGLALSSDDRFLYMVESDTDSVFRFELRTDGTVAHRELYVSPVGRFPDGLALDEEGNLYVSCYASDEIWRIDPARGKTLFAWDRNAILLGRPTNVAFGGEAMDWMYVANLGRTTITRARVGRQGQRLANLRGGSHVAVGR